MKTLEQSRLEMKEIFGGFFGLNKTQIIKNFMKKSRNKEIKIVEVPWSEEYSCGGLVGLPIFEEEV